MKKFFVALCLAAFCMITIAGCNPSAQGEGAPASGNSTTAEEPAE
jgi:hypothetical protein